MFNQQQTEHINSSHTMHTKSITQTVVQNNVKTNSEGCKCYYENNRFHVASQTGVLRRKHNGETDQYTPYGCQTIKQNNNGALNIKSHQQSKTTIKTKLAERKEEV
eukprot:m.59870 g.59870  ORF g.59870 m.59870 type:complete len:106 (+) comp13251_c0_seq1:2068-2385(+)